MKLMKSGKYGFNNLVGLVMFFSVVFILVCVIANVVKPTYAATVQMTATSSNAITCHAYKSHAGWYCYSGSGTNRVETIYGWTPSKPTHHKIKTVYVAGNPPSNATIVNSTSNTSNASVTPTTTIKGHSATTTIKKHTAVKSQQGTTKHTMTVHCTQACNVIIDANGNVTVNYDGQNNYNGVNPEDPNHDGD